MVLGSAAGFLINFLIPLQACRRLGFYPSAGCWGSFDWKLFREMFVFGRDIFMMSLGGQLASASQVIVLSRLLGLEAVSVWAVAGKAFTFAQQFVAKIFDSSSGGLAEMLVRNEKTRLAERFRDLVALTGAVAAVGAAGIALFNSAFVHIWTSGKIEWPDQNNFLLGILLMGNVLIRCHTGLAGITREIRGMKYIYLLEGLGVVVFSFGLVPFWGISGMLVASILSNLCITGTYALLRSASFFKLPLRQIALWPGRGLALALVLFAAAFLLYPVTDRAEKWELACCVSLFGIISAPLFYWLGLGSDLRLDMRKVLEKAFSSLSRKWA
jgi:O-antigen/teichoic acid export membrane protein